MENAERYTGHAKTDIITFPQALAYSARPPLCLCNALVISVEPLSPCTPGQQADLVLRTRNLKSLGKLASVKTRFETCKTDLDSYLHHLVGI